MSAGMFPLQSPKSKERGDRIPFVGPSKQGPIDWPLNSMSWPLLASHFPILLVGWIQEALQVKSGNHTLICVWFGGVDSKTNLGLKGKGNLLPAYFPRKYAGGSVPAQLCQHTSRNHQTTSKPQRNHIQNHIQHYIQHHLFK